MTDDEGSVFVEGEDSSEEEEGSESQETSQSQSQEGSDSSEGTDGNESADAEQTSTLESTNGQEQDQKNEELTEKGTKLAKDPLTQANQLLANERAKIRAYEDVLNNPQKLRGYLAEIDKESGEVKKEESTEPEMRIEDIKTTEDLHKYERQRETKHQKEIQDLKDKLTGVTSTQRDAVVASTISSDISTVRNQYTELDPKPGKDGKPTNPNYNPVLDQAVGALYEKMDFDPQSKSFRGKVSLKEVASFVMGIAGVAKKLGTQEAQTTIRDKRTGKAVTGASNAAPDEKNMTASQIIAARISRASGHNK